MEEKSPELRATLDLIMLSMKQFEEQITTLAKQGYIMEKHKSTLILALYNVGDMVPLSSSNLQGVYLEELKYGNRGFTGRFERNG